MVEADKVTLSLYATAVVLAMLALALGTHPMLVVGMFVFWLTCCKL